MNAIADTLTGVPELPLEERRGVFEMMLRIRHFELRWHRLFMAGKCGPGHSSIGMEAIAAGVGARLRSDDWTYATYRGHAHIIARGTPLRPIMAELLAKGTGLSGGKGGSMHLTSVEHGMMGSYAIIGAHLPVAVGSAMAFQHQGSDRVAVCFFGDGTTNIGAFHEALNLAAVWRLPVVFVCENNGYMEYTPIRSVTAVENPAADRAASYGLDRVIVDGNDPDEVANVIGHYISAARRGDGPALIEAVTYRHLGHASPDPGKYRPDEEVAAWKEKDPIPMYRERLIGAGIPAEELDDLEARIIAEVEDAATFAVESSAPEPHTLDTHIFSNGGSSWRN